MSRSRKKHIIVKDKTGRWYNKLIRRRNRVEVKQIANLTDMLEYNISQPYELVNPWDICDWRFLVDKRDDMFTLMKLESIAVNNSTPNLSQRS